MNCISYLSKRGYVLKKEYFTEDELLEFKKHIIEEYRSGKHIRNNYISNGEFIAAMILLGYKYKKPDCLNLVFNAIRIKDNKPSNNFP